MLTLNKSIANAIDRPVRVLQYGEGNFLRGFVDYMIDVANEKGVFDGSVVIVKPIPYGSLEAFHRQECTYTLSLRGLEEGRAVAKNRIITCITKAFGAYEDYDAYASYACCDSLRFIISNTTEAGIVYDESDSFDMNPPGTYPGKLTKLLYERFSHYGGDRDKGLIILPCELIEDNGIKLKGCVMDYARLWKLGSDFCSWVEEACCFCSTLVDRIVTGYPGEEINKLWEEAGYKDELYDTGELFGLWVIESNRDISEELALHKAGLPVIFTDNLKPYRERKVRILNGAHTSMALASYLAGNDTVQASMQDPVIRKFLENVIYNEIIPTLSLSREELLSFAREVISRFENPFIKHSLLSISLNSVSKWRTRCLPSLLGYVERFSKLPSGLTFSLAALLSFYRSSHLTEDALTGSRNGEPYRIMDDRSILEFFAEASGLDNMDYANEVIHIRKLFGEELAGLPGIAKAVAGCLDNIKECGIKDAIDKYQILP